MTAPSSSLTRALDIGLNEIELELLEAWPVVLNDALHKRLFDMGIADAPRGALDAWHYDSVLFIDGGRFEFGRHTTGFGARCAVIIPVQNEAGDLDDLCAWNPDDGTVAAWRGRASLLGAENVFGPRLDGNPLKVHETALDWLRAGRQGVFIIDPQRAAPILHLAGPLGVQREAFGRRLRDSLTIYAPPIVVSNRRAAA